jgi:flagellar hook-associated protein 2
VSQGLFSVSGIASGLDTQAIIRQLMSLERIPVTRLQQQQADLRKVDDAWKQVNTKLSAMRTALDKVRTFGNVNGMVKVASSNETAVGVASSSVAGTGSMTFSVNRLAAAHQISGPAFTSADSLVADGAGSFSVTVGAGETFTVDVDGTTTLTDLASKLNASGSPVSASVVKVAEGDHRLVLTSKHSGAANQIATAQQNATSLDAASFVQRQAAQDAELVIGEGADALTILRSSNTVDDLVAGATITLKQAGSGPVTVTAAHDVDAAVEAAKKYHEALNDVLSTLKSLSAYDAGANKGGPLTGDPTARRMTDALRGAMINSGAGFPLGFSMTREGGIALDEAKLRQAFTADFVGTARALTQQASTTTTVVTGLTSPSPLFVSATADTQAGAHEVVVNPATHASVRSAAFTPHNQTQTLRIIIDGQTINAEVGANATAAQAAQEITAALGAGSNLSVVAEGGELVFTDSRLGTVGTFTLEAGQRWQNTEIAGTYQGTALSGTINGVLATASADQLTLTAAAGPAAGLTVHGTQAGTFQVLVEQQSTQTITEGAKGPLALMHEALRAYEGTLGLVAKARDALTGRIKLYQDRIDSFEKRLEQREITLRRQFTALETAMGQLNAQGNWLTSQLAGLQANWDRGR